MGCFLFRKLNCSFFKNQNQRFHGSEYWTGFVLAAWIQQQPISLILKALLTGYDYENVSLQMYQGVV